MDSDGQERYRIEGYLPKDWFHARLGMAVARLAFMKKKFADAEKRYAEVIEKFGVTGVVAEAIYWTAVCKYKATNDHTVLSPAALELSQKYPGEEWTLKSRPWSH